MQCALLPDCTRLAVNLDSYMLTVYVACKKHQSGLASAAGGFMYNGCRTVLPHHTQHPAALHAPPPNKPSTPSHCHRRGSPQMQPAESQTLACPQTLPP